MMVPLLTPSSAAWQMPVPVLPHGFAALRTMIPKLRNHAKACCLASRCVVTDARSRDCTENVDQALKVSLVTKSLVTKSLVTKLNLVTPRCLAVLLPGVSVPLRQQSCGDKGVPKCNLGTRKRSFVPAGLGMVSNTSPSTEVPGYFQEKEDFRCASKTSGWRAGW